MKVFAGIPRDDIGRVPDHARWVEDMGYDGINTNEDFSSPFMALTLAAEHTSQALLGTSIAVVFPLSPMNVAYMSWELQKFSRGRFRLGMGSQVKGHIERRFSVPWVAPGPRMREYVLSLKAIWESFQNGGPLRFQGDYYNFSLITPHFSPGPIEYPTPEIFIAAVGPYMFRLAGELCDGVLPHGFMTAKYMDEVGLPNLEKGLQKPGALSRTSRSAPAGSWSWGRTRTSWERRWRRRGGGSPSTAPPAPTKGLWTSTAGATSAWN